MTDSIDTANTDDETSAVVTFAQSVAKDLSVAVIGTVVGLGLLKSATVIQSKLAARKARRDIVNTVNNG